jgi:hypothetical protein
MAEKLENAHTRRGKKSHLPCAGIILFRFYGYYLSLLSSPLVAGKGLAPRELKKTGFPPALQRYVTGDFFSYKIKKQGCNIRRNGMSFN